MATSTNRLQINVSADASEAVAAFKNLSTEMGKMGKDSEDAATQASKVGDALSKLEKSLDNPARLGKAVGAAAMKMQDLKDAMVAAGIVGEKVPAKLAEQFAKVDKVLEAASKRARTYADTVGDFKTRGDIAAKGFEGLASKVGSVDSMMALAMDSGTKLGAVIGTAGFAALGAKAAYDLLRSSLDALNLGYKTGFNAVADWATKGKMAEADMVKMSTAVRVLGTALPITTGNIALMANAFDRMVPNAKRAESQLNDWVKTVDGIKIPKAFTEITDAAVKMEAKLSDAWSKGKADVIAFGLENKSTLDAIADRYRQQGLAVPEWIGKTIKALDDWGKAEQRRKQNEEEAKKGDVEKLKALTAQHDAMVKATEDVKKFVEQANKEKLSTGERAAGMATLAAKYGLTAKGLEELITKGLAYDDAVDKAKAANDEYGGTFDALNAKIQESINKERERRGLLPEGMKEAIDQQHELAKAIQATAFAADNAKAAMEGFRAETYSANMAFQGGAQVIDFGASFIMKAADSTVAAVKKMSAAIDELNKKNESMADRTATTIAALQEAWANGMTDLTTWLKTWSLYYDQMQKIVMLNPGSKMAEDLKLAMKAFEELRQRVLFNQVAKTEHTNWGF